jgi:pimeloyl-ACP methyl ester carboxylesterase
MGAWVLECMSALEIARAAVVGHSMGALVTLETAAQAPDRVAAVGLVGIATPMPVSDALLDAARNNDHAAIDMITLWGHGFGAQIGGNTAPGMWMTGSGVRLLERGAPGVLYNDLNACNEYVLGVEHAAKVTCPALVLLGAQDIMASPRAIGPLMKALPDAQLLQLDPCGHMLMAEQPDAVLDALAGCMRAAYPSAS